MVLSDAKRKRWTPPDDIVARRNSDPKFRLSMSNFKLEQRPFSFSIGSQHTLDTLITTKDQVCYLTDKYM